MDAVNEIKQAIRQLSAADRDGIATWLLDYAGISHGVAEAVPAYGNKLTSSILTVDEYLEFENSSDVRHDYIGGKIYAMSGVSEPHARIVGNLHAACHAHFRGGPCRAYLADFKFHLKAATMMCSITRI
jgi:hypothetical protein